MWCGLKNCEAQGVNCVQFEVYIHLVGVVGHLTQQNIISPVDSHPEYQCGADCSEDENARVAAQPSRRKWAHLMNADAVIDAYR